MDSAYQESRKDSGDMNMADQEHPPFDKPEAGLTILLNWPCV